MTILGFVVGAIGAALAWFLTEFVGRPFRRFFDLRGEVSHRLVQFDNVTARSKMVDNNTRREPIGLPDNENARLTDAENAFRDLASQIRAFAQAEPFAEWIVRCVVGYKAAEISKALIGYSNEIGTYGPSRAHFKKKIEELMRFHPVD
jgi:hypothetical protein